MKAYEIFQEMTPETATAVFQFLRDEQRDVYSASLTSLAANRKLRPVFVKKKSVPQQIDWLVKNIKLRGSGEIAEHVVQLWLLKGNKDLLVDFLDGLGIEHDGEGAAEDIPEKFDTKKLKATVTKLLKDHDAERVRIYLHTFQMQSNEGWPELDKLISATPELQFGLPEEEVEVEKPKVEEKIEEAPVEEAEAVKEEKVEKSEAESEN